MLTEDIRNYCDYLSLKSKLDNCNFFITGITGLIGSLLTRFIVAKFQNVKIIAPVRDLNKARDTFKDIKNNILFVSWDNYVDNIKECQYVVHCAAPTASKFFVEYPVDTFKSIVNLTEKILDAVIGSKNIKSIVNLSSLEVYGEVKENIILDEYYQGYVDLSSVRSSYPMSKRMSENMCSLYLAQYNLPIKIARLTQVSGIGVDPINDNRVFTQFCRLKAHNHPIILSTNGFSSRTYCYTLDAIYGILTILINGINGECYNISNDDTYISARDLAYKIAKINNPVDVRFELDNSKGYPNDTFHRINTAKLRALGWKPKVGLDEMIEKTITYLSL